MPEAREQEQSGGSNGPGRERRWIRAAGLLLAALSLSTVSSAVLILIPFIVCTAVLPRARIGALLVAALAMALVVTAPVQDGLWYVERGWAVLIGGWFVAGTMARPESTFTSRGIGAVLGAVATVSVMFWARPDLWAMVDSMVGARIETFSQATLSAMDSLAGDGGIPETMRQAVLQTTLLQTQVYPGLIAAASLAALGVAWWVYVWLAQGSDRALGPLREFRFNDHLVWMVVSGIALMLWSGGEAGARLGANALVFAATLYVTRGLAVLAFLAPGATPGLLALGLLGMFVVPAFVLGMTAVIGIGDTWLDLRERMRAAAQGPGA